MKRTGTVLMTATALTLVGCSATDSTPETTMDEVTIDVLAAASLQQPFDDIAQAFTAEHPNISVDFNYAGSSTLVQNLADGAPADVFASANETTMDTAQSDETVEADTRQLFAANSLVGIVPADNPADISSLEDANAEGVKLVVCAQQVPCGGLSQTLAEAAGITLSPVSEEQQVSDVLGKVRSGQADAGLVYATDAALAPNEVQTFDLVGADEQLNHYPIARTTNSTRPEAADTFIEYVHSKAGQAILEEHGFTAPDQHSS